MDIGKDGDISMLCRFCGRVLRHEGDRWKKSVETHQNKYYLWCNYDTCVEKIAEWKRRYDPTQRKIKAAVTRLKHKQAKERRLHGHSLYFKNKREEKKRLDEFASSTSNSTSTDLKNEKKD